MGSFFKGKEQTSSSESTTDNSMYQQEYFDKLLGGAGSWFDQGGLSGGPNFTEQMGQIMGQQGQHYKDVLSGDVDRTALNNALTSQADMAQQNLTRNILPSIGSTSNMTGGSGGSRRGIAEGLAGSDASAQLQAQQAQTINQFEQQQMQNKNAAAQGMGGLFGQMGALQEQASGNTEQAKKLQSLLAMQGLISGNMGGTSTTTGTNTGQGQSGLGTLVGLGATAAGAMGSFSDEKLKKNIKKVKINGKKMKTKDGIDVADWEWNKEGEKLGLKGKERGVIAQEAEKKRPDAVGTDPKTGKKKVNYGALM